MNFFKHLQHSIKQLATNWSRIISFISQSHVFDGYSIEKCKGVNIPITFLIFLKLIISLMRRTLFMHDHLSKQHEMLEIYLYIDLMSIHCDADD